MEKKFRFVVIPKVSHPWFEEVIQGARAQAELLQKRLGVEVTVDYEPPAAATPTEQNKTLAKAASTRPDGVALDPVESVGKMPAVKRVQDAGIPLLLFDSPSGDSGIPSVGNDFARQGVIAAEHLVELLGGRGKVAVMRGVPTAPNHAERYDAQLSVLKRYPGVTTVDGGTDNDDIETAREQAARVLASNPDLSGYLCCDAAGPIGIASAIRQRHRAGTLKVVGMDGIRPILEAIREGVIDASSATRPRMQGSLAILMLWEATQGVPIPHAIDTGIDVITRENVAAFLAECH